MSVARLTLASLTALLVSGCALTPDYSRPELGEPTEFRQPVDAGESMANVDWFDIFADPALVRHIETALDENRERVAALARIAEARQLLTVVRADQFPFLGVGASGSRGQQSIELVPGSTTSSEYSVAANLGFQLDIWRKFDRATEAAIADLLATEAGYRSVTIRLVADVAATYLLLLDLDSRLEIAKRTVTGRADRLGIIKARFDQGVVAELDLNQAQGQLAIAEAVAAALERDVLQTENALRLLLGQFPGPIARGKSLKEWDVSAAVPTGIPADLLHRRPDLVAAEQALVAETALIGVAEALRWPSLSLTGSFGVASSELSGLNSNDAEFWGASVDILAPIFNAGQRKADAAAQRARAEQALSRYEGAVRQAFREVEDALISVRSYRTELAARIRQVNAARNAARLSRARYDAGNVDFLEVLDSERNLFDAELVESATRQAAIVALVRLYEALGGGWTN